MSICRPHLLPRSSTDRDRIVGVIPLVAVSGAVTNRFEEALHTTVVDDPNGGPSRFRRHRLIYSVSRHRFNANNAPLLESGIIPAGAWPGVGESLRHDPRQVLQAASSTDIVEADFVGRSAS